MKTKLKKIINTKQLLRLTEVGSNTTLNYTLKFKKKNYYLSMNILNF
jgi:hypothetical protein